MPEAVIPAPIHRTPPHGLSVGCMAVAAVGVGSPPAR